METQVPIAGEDVERCYELGWTDGLPVVPPTPERVEAMLDGLVDKRYETVAVLEPTSAMATYEKVAANAVMAGCLPEYFPIVVAAIEAVADPAFLLDSDHDRRRPDDAADHGQRPDSLPRSACTGTPAR